MHSVLYSVQCSYSDDPHLFEDLNSDIVYSLGIVLTLIFLRI